MRRLTVTMVAAALVLTVLGPMPAAAQESTADLACPHEVVPDAGFTDVDPASVHDLDIDCVVWFGISTGTSPTTFEPKAAVTRWQMALFLMRTFGVSWGQVVNGGDQGFTDIGHHELETQTAINQLRQLSITSGTSPTTFAPDGTLSRWEMALFLTRLLRALGVALPDGATQGFTDIADLPPATQTAVNQLAQLGITQGTTPTTFSPHDQVTREQMASFLVRTLQAQADIELLAQGSGSCDGLDPETCTYDLTFPGNRAFVFRNGWAVSPLPADPGFFTPSTRVELTQDGFVLALSEKVVNLHDAVFKYFEAGFPTGLSGNHTFVVSFYDNDQFVAQTTVNLSFTVQP